MIGYRQERRKKGEGGGGKSIAMIKQKELLPLTGYIHGGCSPIRMKKLFPTFLHETAMTNDANKTIDGV